MKESKVFPYDLRSWKGRKPLAYLIYGYNVNAPILSVLISDALTRLGSNEANGASSCIWMIGRSQRRGKQA